MIKATLSKVTHLTLSLEGLPAIKKIQATSSRAEISLISYQFHKFKKFITELYSPIRHSQEIILKEAYNIRGSSNLGICPCGSKLILNL